MADLVKQPTLSPTRKLWAVILTGALMGALNSAIAVFYPGNSIEDVFPGASVWVSGALMSAAGYLTSNRAV